MALSRRSNRSTTPFVVEKTITLPVLAIVLLLLVAGASPSFAQDSGRGFRFNAPTGSITVRGGFAHGGVGGDSSIYAFARRELTLGDGAFNSPAFGMDLAFRLSQRLDMVFGLGVASSKKDSEFRDWVDQDDRPIEQTTSLKRIPLTASLKAYVKPRGRSIGNYAWIPSKYAPFIGAGGGMMWYRFRQQGDFVDIDSPSYDIFTATFESSRWTPTGHVMAGVDYSLNTRLGLTTEGRYTWARTELSSDFSGFDPIDLSGFSLTLGLFVRF